MGVITAGSQSRPWYSTSRVVPLSVILLAVAGLVASFSSVQFTTRSRSAVLNRRTQQQPSRCDVSMGMMGRLTRRRRLPFLGRRNKDVGFASSKNTMVSTLPIMVKDRPRVTLNAETGEMLVQERMAQSQTSVKPRRRGKWNAIKQSVYGTADAISSVPKLFRRNKDEEIRPIEGYADTIEQTILVKPSSPPVIISRGRGDTPGKRLMKQLESNPRAFIEEAEEQVSQQKSSAWDSVKSGVYDTIDGVSGLFFADEAQSPKSTPISSFKPVTQESLSTSSTIKEAIPDLNSPNPIQKLKAEFAIREWEKEQERKKLEIQREEFAADFKESTYQVFDTIGGFVEMLKSLPDKTVETANAIQQFAIASVEWIASIPGKVEQVVQQVQAVPANVQKSVDETKASIDNGIEITKAVVEDVKAIPQTVSQSVEDAKRTVIETQQALEEAVTNVKVLVGAEKPKPKPPKMPPKAEPLETKEMAWKVAGGVATGAAKAAWWAGKGAVSLGWKGAKVLWSKASETEAAKDMAGQLNALSTQATDFIPSNTPPKTKAEKPMTTAAATPPEAPPTISKQEQDDLDREVSEAMKLAEEAIKMADDEKTSVTELDLAVQRARQAALKATRDALQIEKSLKEEKLKEEKT